MPFFECEFPRAIAFDSKGGDRFFTTVNRGFSGSTQTNRNWAMSLAYFLIDLNAKPQDYFELVKTFFLNVGGKADGFRFFWPLDNQMTNQIIAIADGSVNPSYQLIKTYTVGSRTYTRTIVKPIMHQVLDFQGNALTDTVQLFDNGSPLTLSAVDYTTGICTVSGTPATGHTITANCQFHIPVRFDVDDMKNAQVLESDVYGGNALVTWTQLGMEEVRI